MPARLTLTGQTVYSRDTGAVTFGKPCTRVLEGDEQPYRRERVADERWDKLDCGWVEMPAMIVVENCGEFTLELCVRAPRTMTQPMEADLFVPPGESHRYSPIDVSTWRIRAADGDCPYTIAAIPR